ncbi:MAG: hypothetical protein ABS965_06870, partial [Succiniclasticum sp.]
QPVFPKVGDISLAGAVNVNVLNNDATVNIGNYTEIKAGAGQAAINSDTYQNTVVMNGRPNIDLNFSPFLDLLYGEDSKERKAALKNEGIRSAFLDECISIRPNTSGPNAVGGTVGVMEAGTTSKVNIGDYAAITGYSSDPETDSIQVKANDETVLTGITYGAGVSGKVGFEGMFGWLGGNVDTGVDMGQGVKIEAKSADTTPAYGNVRVESTVNAVMTNMVGEISISNGVAAGLSAGITDYSVSNIVNMQNAAAGGAGSRDPLTIEASGLDVAALTDGVINTITLAGTMSYSGSGDQNVNENTEQNTKIGGIETAGDTKSKKAAKTATSDVEEGVTITDNQKQIGDGDTSNVALISGETKAPELKIAGAGSVA